LETTTAVTPPMLNEAGLPRFVPVMVTSVPTGPVVGLNEVIAGAAASNACPDHNRKIAVSKSFDLISYYFSDILQLFNSQGEN